MKNKLLMQFMFLGLWLISTFAYSLDVSVNFSRMNLKQVCSVITDSEQTQGTPEAASILLSSNTWKPCTEVDLARGYSTDQLWLKFDFNNLDEQDILIFLNTFPSWTSRLSVYSFQGNQLVDTQEFGVQFPYEARAIPSSNFIIPISLAGKQQKIVLIHAVSNFSFLLGGEVVGETEMLRSVATLNFLNGLIIGSIAIISFYNLFIFLSIRDTNYFFYFLYSSSMFFMLSIIYGFGYQYLWPESIKFNSFMTTAAPPFNAIFMTLFVRKFLNLYRVSSLMDSILKFFMYASLVTIVVSAFPKFQNVATIWSGVLAVLGAPTVLVSGILALLKGEKSAKYFLIAWVLSILSMMLMGLMITGIIEFNFYLFYSFSLGIFLEMTLLSLALANKIHFLQLDKAEATAAVLKSEMELTKNLATAAAQLEYKVSIRTHDLAQEKRRAEVQARTDALTGLNNRRAFFEKGEKLFQSVREQNDSNLLTVIMVDIDFFKKVNDRYGHSAGDLVITSVALSLLPHFMGSSVVGRIGGEEFAVVIKGINSSLAEQLAEQARVATESREITSEDGQRMKVTISLGVAAYRATDQSVDETLARADIALYQAKESGRNKVVLLV
ncbi:diguanylate cyclase [Reinekea sp.]|uniref:sensor domain-containing diguanylate cyclase n=3 Tax=Reinekea sp. TaxID=1970455 RepID=UPI00398905DE